MKSLIVTCRSTHYVVESRYPNGATRYLTDRTLPDEIKHKLGLLMFGSKDKTVGWYVGEQLDWVGDNPDPPVTFVVRVGEDTYEQVIGRVGRDTGSESESEGQKDSE